MPKELTDEEKKEVAKKEAADAAAAAAAEAKKKEAEGKTVEELQTELDELKESYNEVMTETISRRKTIKELKAKMTSDTDDKAETLEEAQKEVTKLQKKLDTQDSKMLELEQKQAFLDTVGKLKLKFVNKKAQTDALSHIDWDNVSFDDDGKVLGMDAEVKRIKKERSYLFETKEPPDVDSGNKGGPPEADVDALAEEKGEDSVYRSF